MPEIEAGEDRYATALLRLLERQPARMVLPAHDGSIEAIRRRRSEFERLTAVPMAPEPALDVAVNKQRTLALAAELRIPCPRGVSVTSPADVAPALRHVGYPAVMKPVQSWLQAGPAPSRWQSIVVRNQAEAMRYASGILRAAPEVLIQEWLPGRREAVTLFHAQDRVWARFAQFSHREWPVIGGASVFYESVEPPSDTVSDAERLVRSMGLDGCSVVEFRRDRQGRPALMEVNPRMPGSVALAISCGVDFPGLLWQWASGQRLQEVRGYRIGQRMRWLTGDLFNLKSVFRDPGHPDAPPRARALATFFTDFARRPSPIDPFDIEDPRPAFTELGCAVGGELRRHVAKLRTRRDRC